MLNDLNQYPPFGMRSKQNVKKFFMDFLNLQFFPFLWFETKIGKGNIIIIVVGEKGKEMKTMPIKIYWELVL